MQTLGLTIWPFPQHIHLITPGPESGALAGLGQRSHHRIQDQRGGIRKLIRRPQTRNARKAKPKAVVRSPTEPRRASGSPAIWAGSGWKAGSGGIDWGPCEISHTVLCYWAERNPENADCPSAEPVHLGVWLIPEGSSLCWWVPSLWMNHSGSSSEISVWSESLKYFLHENPPSLIIVLRGCIALDNRIVFRQAETLWHSHHAFSNHNWNLVFEETLWEIHVSEI